MADTAVGVTRRFLAENHRSAVMKKLVRDMYRSNSTREILEECVLHGDQIVLHYSSKKRLPAKRAASVFEILKQCPAYAAAYFDSVAEDAVSHVPGEDDDDDDNDGDDDVPRKTGRKPS